MIGRFRQAPIRLQFIVLAAIPIPAVLLSIIALLPEPYIFKNGLAQTLVTVRRTQIELIVGQVRNSASDADAEKMLRASAPVGLDMRLLPWGDFNVASSRREHLQFVADELRNVLPADFEAVVLPQDAEHNALAVRVDAKRGLLVRFSDADTYPAFFGVIVELVAKILILILPMLLLVLYIGGVITSPLVRFAEAAKSLRLDSNEEELFTVAGAKELRTLATALNEMRHRIRKMLDDRTRMLTAVSHDLRTPLTRLRMRVERSKEIPSRQLMLDDIATLTAMIEDSLQYLSSTARDEALRKVDIAALLKTIVAGFCDLGHTVIYVGPERFGYSCKQKGLTRAITNIVENAVRFGTIVHVQLSNYPPGEVAIVVRDNGPGLAQGLHEKALEPFFKADEARASNSNSGFGLGLSIADEIVKGHGGSLNLENVVPHGLRVKFLLPQAQIVSSPAAKAAEAQTTALAG
ncbi:MAG: HAMP domain-containing histidine kinase [Mesorhizobium sp.]|uniref:sensor histidine kinase n=1 Tax=Mesorhizobium sp. TaxID=1871066 RepID=UPI000FE89649|nr:HAMP domain-containing sensor histidine kinase [Mesorhizobium sp.]RWD66541.1 MAG: HAMP domain-containing histidine kinase [Mesorhizobium sp.]RWE50450.1 MAG: HAMP domain-containing histidine kinase [Mesorhizobium sp.]